MGVMTRLLGLWCMSMLVLIVKAEAAYGPPPEEWAKRSIIQVLTDRFSLADCPSEPPRCKDLVNACGGTHVGLRQRLDYIQGMGFSSIWMSPVTSQTGGPIFEQQDGWHGYWPKDFYDLNSLLGAPVDLKALVSAMHSRDMWVMLDIVPNHQGYFSLDKMHEMTFDRLDYYHSCQGCDPTTCTAAGRIRLPIQDAGVICRLQGLPDLNQTVPHVRDTLHHWMAWMRDTYHIDGFRVDAAKHMYPFFLQEMKKRAGIFTMGESYYTDWYNGTFALSRMLNDNQLHSMLSYALYGAAYLTFMTPFSNTTVLKNAVELTLQKMPNHTHILGNFLDNQDRPRISNSNYSDATMVSNALTYTFFIPGIPIVFYGTEAGLLKAHQPLWEDYAWDTSAPLYVRIKMLNWYRRELHLWDLPYTTLLADGLIFVFRRGDAALVVISSVAARLRSNLLPRKVQLTRLPQGMAGKMMENIFDSSVKLLVSPSGSAVLELNSLEPLVFVHKAISPTAFVPQKGASSLLMPLDYTVLVVTLVLMLGSAGALRLCVGPRCFLAGCCHPKVQPDALCRGPGSSSSSSKGVPGDLPGDNSETAPLYGGEEAVRSDEEGAGGLSHGHPSSNHVMSLPYPYWDVGVRAQPLHSSRDSLLMVVSGSSPWHQWTDQQPGQQQVEVPRHQQPQRPSQEQGRHVIDGHGSATVLPGRCSSSSSGSSSRDSSQLSSRSDDSWGSGFPNPLTGLSSFLVPNIPKPEQQQKRCQSRETQRLTTQKTSCSAASLTAMKGSKAAGSSSDASQASLHGSTVGRSTVSPECVMHVAMEYTIPHLGMEHQFVYGGLGKVVDTFIKKWPGDLAVCAPLYATAYSRPGAAHPAFAPGPPALSFSVWVGHTSHQVEIFDYTVPGKLSGKSRRYFLIQAEIFRHRSREGIYTFGSEQEMLTWLSVFNQAVAEVVLRYSVQRMQLHDYHGALALQYLSKGTRPQVLYVAHNAHYNGVFALPTKHRAAHLYSMFHLNPAAVGRYTEHKSAFDTLHSLLVHINEAQGGIGCAAVSPKYASEIRRRLSPFWQIPAGKVMGILNAMDCSGTWGGQGLAVRQVEVEKCAAKLQLQGMLGLDVGEQYQLAVFLGRLTHQKGVDILAKAAPELLARHKDLQMVVIGPLGDVTGADAQEVLGALAMAYPGRLLAPFDYYVEEEEKALLLRGADFCICPSRYEPCGLVDIEFGWYGALTIGNATGGLGKMPGFYFKADAATLPHLAAKLVSAFDEALSSPSDHQRSLRAASLAKRFPVQEQMEAYGRLWKQIDAACAAAERQHLQAADPIFARQVFFAESWRHTHLTQEAAALAVSPTAAAMVMGGGGHKAFRKFMKQHKPRQLKRQQLTRQQVFSNHLVLVLQSLSLLPSLLLLAYMVLQQISRQTWGTCPLRPHDQEWLPALNPLGLRVLWYVLLSTAAAPGWTYLAFKKTPRSYICIMCFTTLACLLLVLLAFVWQSAMNCVLLLVSPAALAGVPLVGLAFLGYDQEISEVGYRLIRLSDGFKGLLLAGCAALTVLSTSHLPFLLTSAAAVVATAAAATWVSCPGTLPPAYTHLKLNMCWREQGTLFRSGPKSLWLTLAVAVLDMAGLGVLGFLLSSLQGLAGMVAINGACFAAGVVAVILATALLRSPCMQLHVHATTLLLAVFPGAAVLKGLAAWMLQPLWLVVAVAGGVELLMGARAPLNGFLAMLALPSREAVALWQLLAVVLGNMTLMAVVGVVLGLQVPPAVLVTPLLLCLGGIEGARLLCGVVLGRVHHRENLSAL